MFMDLNEAFDIVNSICRGYKGTYEDHVKIDRALKTIKTSIELKDVKISETDKKGDG